METRRKTTEEYEYIKGYLLHDVRVQKKKHTSMSVMFVGIAGILWMLAWNFIKMVTGNIQVIKNKQEILIIAVVMIVVLIVFGIWISIHTISDFIKNEPKRYKKMVLEERFQVFDVMVKDIESCTTYVDGIPNQGNTAIIYDMNGNVIPREDRKAAKKTEKLNTDMTARQPVISQLQEGQALLIHIDYCSSKMINRVVILPPYQKENPFCQEWRTYYSKSKSKI